MALDKVIKEKNSAIRDKPQGLNFQRQGNKTTFGWHPIKYALQLVILKTNHFPSTGGEPVNNTAVEIQTLTFDSDVAFGSERCQRQLSSKMLLLIIFICPAYLIFFSYFLLTEKGKGEGTYVTSYASSFKHLIFTIRQSLQPLFLVANISTQATTRAQDSDQLSYASPYALPGTAEVQ